MHFVIAHPEFWPAGGAERLLISIIRCLRQNGHTLEIVCAYMDRTWFEEGVFKPDEVTLIGSSMMGGDWHMQMILFALKIVFWRKQKPDVFLADSSPAALPIIRFFSPMTKVFLPRSLIPSQDLL